MAHLKDKGKTQAGINLMELDFRSSDPSDPDDNKGNLWISDGTESGDNGDVMMKINDGSTTKTVTLVDFSAE